MNVRAVLAVVIAVVLAVLVQATWLGHLTVRGEWPDLALVVVLMIGLLFGFGPGLVAGVTAGLMMGLMLHLAEPAFFASRVAAGVGASALRPHWSRENVLVQVAAVLLGSVGCEVVFGFLTPAVLNTPGWLDRVLVRAILNAALAPVVAALVLRLPLPRDLAEP